jgi:hypothetical protein
MANYEHTQEEIQEAYSKAPAHVQEAMASEQMLEVLASIGQKHELDEDQTRALIDTSGLLMLGLTPKDRYAGQLEEQLGLDSAAARALSVDVISAIFERILGGSSSPPPLPGRSQVLYEDERCRVTYATLEVGPTTYPINKVASVMSPMKIGWLSPTHWITVALTNGEELRIERKKQEEVQSIYVALRKALAV